MKTLSFLWISILFSFEKSKIHTQTTPLYQEETVSMEPFYEPIPVPPFLPCCRQSTDHNPEFMLKVFKHPKDYLSGPRSNIDNSVPKMHFVIIGAGIAGLSSAYMLLEVGHKVTILESNNRIGGRIFTERKGPRGNRWYGDMGAMRFPPDTQPIVNGIFDFLNIPMATFADFNNRDSSYYFFGEEYFNGSVTGSFDPNAPPPDEPKLKEMYELFGIRESDIPKNASGYLNPYKVAQDLLENSAKAKDLKKLCIHDESEASFVAENLRSLGLEPNSKLLNFFNTIKGLTPYSTYSILTYIILAKLNELDVEDEASLRTPGGGNGRREVKGGADLLTRRIYQAIRRNPDFEIVGGKRGQKADVRKIAYYKDTAENYKVKVQFIHEKRRPRFKTIYGDYAIITPTSKIVSQFEFQPRLPFTKLNALNSIFYFNSAKIFLNFKTPFWKFKNKIPRIPFDDVQPGVPSDNNTVNGAACVSDDILKQVYYPSHAFHGNSLLVSYTFNKDAQFFSALTEKEIVDLALKALAKRHGDVVYREFDYRKRRENSAIQRWDLDNHFHAAFVEYGVQQRNEYLEELLKSHENLLFSGESSNKFHNGWVEGVLESSVRNLIKLWPDEYERKFGEDERNEYDGGKCRVQDFLVDRPYPELAGPRREWSDSEFSDYGFIRQIYGNTEDAIYSIQFKFGETFAPQHGTSGGSDSTTYCNFDPDEKIIKVKGYFTSDGGGFLIHIEFITDKPGGQLCKITGDYSSNIDYTFEYTHPGFYLAYTSGTDSKGWPKSIGLHWRKIY